MSAKTSTAAHPDSAAAHAHFWELAEPWLARDGVERSTMMGFPCLRVQGAYFASIENKGEGLVVKLPKLRVIEAVASGEGQPFAPAGRTFREWLRVPYAQASTWPARLEEAFAFVSGAQ